MNRNAVKMSALALAGAAVFLTGSMGGAVAARMIDSSDIENNSLQQEDLRRNSVGNSELQDDAIRWGNLHSATQQLVRDLAGTNGVDGERGLQGEPGIQGVQGPKGEPGDPASDTLGELASEFGTLPTPIQKIGGTFSTSATTLGTLTIEEDGKYLVSAYGYFDRLNEGVAGYVAPTTDTYLQLTVRGGTGHPGTCFTGAVSPRGFTETTCQSVQVITAQAGDVLSVRAFGYNEDRSGFGGVPNTETPQFTAAAAVSAVRIGNLAS